MYQLNITTESSFKVAGIQHARSVNDGQLTCKGTCAILGMQGHDTPPIFPGAAYILIGTKCTQKIDTVAYTPLYAMVYFKTGLSPSLLKSSGNLTSHLYFTAEA